jgi:membrane protease YdiL (CAAX protease family)
VLKSVIQGDPVPWMHLTVSLLASATVAAVVISWCAKLLDSERFLFPQLAAAGWGRFRKWGEPDASPDGVGALAVFAVSLAVFMGAGIILVAAPLMAQVALPLIAIGLVPVAATWLMGHRPGIALGTAAPRSKAMVAALLMSPLALALSLSLGALQSLAMPPQTPEQLERLIQTLQALEAQAGIFGLLLVAAVLPGLCEELLFRGFILRGLTASLGARTGVILSSLLFALLHMSPWRFLPQFALGVALAVLTLRTGSVWPAVFVHFAHNATVLLIGDDDTSAPADNQVDTSIGAIAGTVAVAILAVVGMVFVLRAAACRRDSAR